MAKLALANKPKILISGCTAYPRDLDYKRLREIADSVSAYLLIDMSHVSGLIATKNHNNPFEYADVVTSTTHKTLRGPRAGMIFYRIEKEGKNAGLKEKINFAVFPTMQGGPHNHQIAAIATQLKEVATEDFAAYSKQIIVNAKQLAKTLMAYGHKVVTDGTDNHLILLDIRPEGLTGSKLEKACDLVYITLNKNTLYGDKSALTPGGVRIGTPAVTTRGMLEKDMEKIGEFIDRTIKLCVSVQKRSGKNLKEFIQILEKEPEIEVIRNEVIVRIIV